MNEEDLKKLIDQRIREYAKGGAFTDRKLTDTPTDANMVVSRKYVTLNGATANRPTASVIGQFYFDTDDNAPRWVGNGYAWVDSTGTPA